MCDWGKCTNDTETNPKTGKPFVYCQEHRDARKSVKRAYYQRTRVKQNARQLAKWHDLREQFFQIYGDKCNCCGVEGRIFLALDHVRNNGKEHRARRGKFGVYQDAVAEHQPTEYQVLCHNCNFAKYQLGECPHALVPEGVKHGK